ncbi:ABC transporter ATP-binding protein [Psychroflexus aestuariivivens]|uniref:ABC transporter ATP-binding protein n=1 Tax=Psychroflexus aestuariivivens TaxID=1795040 RepID=UPI000FDA6665|nr:ABC transporter ATP-binding protein [Psychroflexus aestuariivivens]
MNEKVHSKNILKAENLSIGYKRQSESICVAKNIDFEIKTKELVAVIGVNGSGKSTLLKTLSNILPPLSGNIFLNESSLTKIDQKKLSNLISLVLTNESISKNMSILELVTLGRHPYTNWLGTLTTSDQRKVLKAIEQVGMLDLRNKSCDSLSDGQFQKVLIARALAQDTPLIIMDEPTSHLDMYHKAYVLQLLKSITKTSQKSIVFASHEINLALQLCDRIILINNGKINVGTPSKLIKNGAFEKLFPKDLIVFDQISQSFRMKIS